MQDLESVTTIFTFIALLGNIGLSESRNYEYKCYGQSPVFIQLSDWHPTGSLMVSGSEVPSEQCRFDFQLSPGCRAIFTYNSSQILDRSLWHYSSLLSGSVTITDQYYKNDISSYSFKLGGDGSVYTYRTKSMSVSLTIRADERFLLYKPRVDYRVICPVGQFGDDHLLYGDLRRF